MNVHKNARLTPHGRERIVRQVESGQTPKGHSTCRSCDQRRTAVLVSSVPFI